MNYFKYSDIEINYLKEKDILLFREIEKIGMVKREIESDLFMALISSIISQQISTKSAITVKDRLIDLIGEINPKNIDKINIEDIQKCGMSMRKAGYIKGIGEAVNKRLINFEGIQNLTDNEIISEMTKLKGVGEWTVEMLLIHSLERPDILSYKDLGIQRGLKKLYGLEKISKKEFEIYRNRYTPYNTVASIYLWEISKNDYVVG